MKPKIAKIWVQALRSGEYSQGRTRLNRDGLYCCLGVLCELAVKEGVIPPGLPTISNGTEKVFAYGERAEVGLPPPEVVRWAGMKSRTGYITSMDPAVPAFINTNPSLAHLNDFGVPFSEIADAIERNIPTL